MCTGKEQSLGRKGGVRERAGTGPWMPVQTQQTGRVPLLSLRKQSGAQELGNIIFLNLGVIGRRGFVVVL